MELIILIAVIVGALTLRRQNQRLKRLETLVLDLERRVTFAGEPVAASPLLTTPESEVLGVAADIEPAVSEEPVETITDGPWAQAAARKAEEPETVSEPVAAEPSRNIETALGTRWAVWVGGLALAFGGVFLVRYSIEAGIFGPGVRLSFAALFGLLLAAAGEFTRRHGFRAPVGGVNGAYVPAILTAAATFTLFSAVYAAHSIYGFVGPTAAFALLAIIALGTMGLALLHGQALGGLGLLGAYATPVLVASQSPSAWSLFVYLSVAVAAAIAVASIRHWRFLASSAFLGAGFWSVLYLMATAEPLAAPVVLLSLVTLGALGGLWLAKSGAAQRIDPATLIQALFVFLIALHLARGNEGNPVVGGLWAAIVLVAALGVAVWRERATPLVHAAGLAMLPIAGWQLLSGNYAFAFFGDDYLIDGIFPFIGADLFRTYAFVLAALFLSAGCVLAQRFTAQGSKLRAFAWALWAAIVPLWVIATTWLSIGDINVDWLYAALLLVLAAILAVAAEMLGRAEEPTQTGGLAVSALAAGSTASIATALIAGFGPVVTTILIGLAAALPTFVTRSRTWPVLGWLSAAFSALTIVRIGADPTIAGYEFLSTTPFFNALLPGYFIPAAAAAFAAWQLARTTNGRPRLAMEVVAALFALVGAAMLVRHAMNGGVILTGAPSLGEQAIYTLIMIGGGALMLALDTHSPSPVLRWGSMVLGVMSMLFIVVAHLIELNPLMTNESTGRIPLINLLLLAYLLPAAALAALAWRARDLRPDWYVRMLAGAAIALAFAYVSLSIRRLFQGEFIGAWKGMDGVETYTYSAVWLLLGVLVLAAGVRFNSRALRLGSAALVILSVAKVFLYDMRELEGVLRAVSFMGLGAVLIGIGLFYQKMLVVRR